MGHLVIIIPGVSKIIDSVVFDGVGESEPCSIETTHYTDSDSDYFWLFILSSNKR